MGVETELKFKVSRESLTQVERSTAVRRHQVAPARTMDVVSVYYDTRRRDLQKRGVTFRLRRQGDRHLQTVKADNGGYPSRLEWEHPVAANKPDFAALAGTGIEPIFDKAVRRGLKPLFETRVRRTVAPLRWRGSNIELALDRGKVKTGRAHTPISEVEIELKDGDPRDLFAAARALTKVAPVRLSMLSKAEAGYRLADSEPDRPLHATPIALDRGATCGEAFRTVGHACLRQVVANEAAVEIGDSEGVHQMRVGLRRLRAALAVFSDITEADGHVGRIKSNLKWITGELAPARDLDVYLHKSAKPLDGAEHPPVGAPALEAVTQRGRQSAFARARTAVRSDRYRGIIFDVAAWLSAGDWVTKADKMQRARLGRPVLDFARDEMERRRRKIVKARKKFDRRDMGRRHKLRIRAKKLRYATEFFAALFSGKKSAKRCRRIAKALKRLQDSLGDLNDFAVHDQLAKQLVLSEGVRRKGRRRAFAAGVIAGEERSRRNELLDAARDALADLAALNPC